MGNEALDDKVDGDLYVMEEDVDEDEAAAAFDCSGCTSATSGARYLTFEFVEEVAVTLLEGNLVSSC